MDDHSKGERQRKERDARLKERNARQMERELVEQRRELERMQEQIDRQFRHMTEQQHEISWEEELDYEERESSDSEFEDAEETHESMQTRSSIWSSIVSGAALFLTPSFLKKGTATSTPASILKKKSTAPRMRQLNYAEEKETALGSLSFQEQRGRGLFPSTAVQDLDISSGREGPIMNIREEQRSSEEQEMLERIRALKLQAERMAQQNEQRQQEESQLTENIKVIDQRKREISKEEEKQRKLSLLRQEEEKQQKILLMKQEEEKQRKLLLMKEEEEKLKQLLQLQHDEEVEHIKRIEMLQQKETLMKMEMEEALKLLGVRKTQENIVYSQKDTAQESAYSLEQTERGRKSGETGSYDMKQIFEESGANPKMTQKKADETEDGERWRDAAETGSKYTLKQGYKDLDSHLKFLYDKEHQQGTLDQHINVDSSKGKEVVEKITDSGSVQKAFIGSFSGAIPRPKNENTYEDWRMEVEALIACKSYPEVSITQAIRKSLKVPAKRHVLHMNATSTPREITAKLENVYGNVACGQAILQEFYTAEQSSEESVADWALRLEELMKRAVEKGYAKEEEKDQMISTKFWRGLYNQDLKNATKMFYKAEKGFDSLLVKVRYEEYELTQSKARTDDKKKKAQHHPIQGSSDKQTEMLNSIMEKMNSIDKKVNRLESRVGAGRGRFDKGRDNFDKGRGRGRGRGRGQGQSESEQKAVGQQNLNENIQNGTEGKSENSKNE